MRNSLRLSFGTFALVALAACSHSTDAPALSDDLKQDLAKAGGGDVELAGTTTPKLEVVSASERTKSPTPAPKAPTVSRAPSATRGSSAVVKNTHQEAPAAAQTATRPDVSAPVEVLKTPPIPEPFPDRAGRPEAPRPSTQREPKGGWRTPGQVIRNAPFPINP
jgi:hypothetical protein